MIAIPACELQNIQASIQDLKQRYNAMTNDYQKCRQTSTNEIEQLHQMYKQLNTKIHELHQFGTARMRELQKELWDKMQDFIQDVTRKCIAEHHNQTIDELRHLCTDSQTKIQNLHDEMYELRMRVEEMTRRTGGVDNDITCEQHKKMEPAPYLTDSDRGSDDVFFGRLIESWYRLENVPWRNVRIGNSKGKLLRTILEGNNLFLRSNEMRKTKRGRCIKSNSIRRFFLALRDHAPIVYFKGDIYPLREDDLSQSR
jgi:hypothetical protein